MTSSRCWRRCPPGRAAVDAGMAGKTQRRPSLALRRATRSLHSGPQARPGAHKLVVLVAGRGPSRRVVTAPASARGSVSANEALRLSSYGSIWPRGVCVVQVSSPA